MPRDFPTEAVISAATGFLLCPIVQVYEVCSYMAGEPVWTHQLGRVANEIEPALLARQPNLAETFSEARQITRENWQEHLDRFVKRHGPTMTVAPLSEDQHQRIDPVSELAETVPPDRILPIVR